MKEEIKGLIPKDKEYNNQRIQTSGAKHSALMDFIVDICIWIYRLFKKDNSDNK